MNEFVFRWGKPLGFRKKERAGGSFLVRGLKLNADGKLKKNKKKFTHKRCV